VLCAAAGLVVPSAAAAEAPVAHTSADRVDQDVIHEVNAIRSHYGLRRMREASSLDESAAFHSWEMMAGNYFGHQSMNGTSFGSRMTHFVRARRVGETIGWMSGFRGSQSRIIVRSWMNSPEHRAALLSRGYHRIGVGRRAGAFGGGRATVFTADLAS
jgi:uncharacterized protein YkwD